MHMQVIKAAGLELVEVVDTTKEASQVAKRWHDSRDMYKEELRVCAACPIYTYQSVKRGLC